MNMQIVQNQPLIRLPDSDLQFEQYLIGRSQKPANFGQNWSVFPTHSRTIGRITNLKARGERVVNSVQSTY